VGGAFDDADLLGLDAGGGVTWSTRLEGSVAALDTCDDGTHALVVERVPGSWWATNVRSRITFVDLRDGSTSPPHGVRRVDAESSWFTALCTSGAQRRGWLETTVDDFDRASAHVIVDEIVDGAAHRVALPADVVTGALGDGFLIGQTSEPTPGRWTQFPPGRLVRTDLRTGATVTGPLLPSRSPLLALSPDGSRLVTAHGPIRTWDVTNGFRLEHSFPDTHRGTSQLSGAWDDHGRLVLLDQPYDDLGPRPGVRGRFHVLDPAAGTLVAHPGWPRDVNDSIGIATRDRFYSWRPYASTDDEAGLRAFDPATNRWTTMSPATVAGTVEHADVVR
jgi:hypothetical protein